MCIWSKAGNGMLCKGVTYIGIGSLSPIRWAKWINNEQKLEFDESKPLNGDDDILNWYTNSVKFDGIWTEYRWMPKDQL